LINHKEMEMTKGTIGGHGIGFALGERPSLFLLPTGSLGPEVV
jgi:hypothetical protein